MAHGSVGHAYCTSTVLYCFILAPLFQVTENISRLDAMRQLSCDCSILIHPFCYLQGFESRGTEIKGRLDAMRQLSCDCSITQTVTLQDLDPNGQPSIRPCPP